MSVSSSEKNKRQFLNLARGKQFVGKIRGENGLVNLAGNYDYLSYAYYVSQDYDNEYRHIRPLWAIKIKRTVNYTST